MHEINFCFMYKLNCFVHLYFSAIHKFSSIGKDEIYEDLIRENNTSCVPSKWQLGSELSDLDCYCYKHDGVVARANSMNTYWQVNRQVSNFIC